MEGNWRAAAASSFSSGRKEVSDALPLRSLSPMFPASVGLNSFSQEAASPFICVTPYGSFAPRFQSGFPDGFNAFYPSSFAPRNATQKPPPAATAVGDSAERKTSNGGVHVSETVKMNGRMHEESRPPPFQTPPSAMGDSNNEESDLSPLNSASYVNIEQPIPLRSIPMGSTPDGDQATENKLKRKRSKKNPERDPASPQCSASESRESVEVVLITFDALRRRLLQLDVAKESNNRAIGKAGTTMMENDLRANKIKRIGSIPGVEVGDIFFCRIEMCLVGLHFQSVSGIDYMMAVFDDEEDPVAVCVVSSGGYGYVNDDSDVDSLVYTGQGGSDKDDQKLERGNLAMERSLHRGNEVRVVRAVADSGPSGKVYVYDGLYKITQSWVEKAKKGFNVFKYKMVRVPGQPDGLALWRRTTKWRQDSLFRSYVILADMSSGAESIPVCLVNEVDADKGGPCPFTYVTELKYPSQNFSANSSNGCSCTILCGQADVSCQCAQRNGGDLPYCLGGILVSHKRIVYECGASCQCSSKCKNKITQRSIALHFEVFKTKDRGWALRSWDAIRAGTFVCEYTGEVIDDIGDDEDDDFFFRASYADDKAFKWNYVPELLGETPRPDSSEDVTPLSIAINAKKMGNVSRFINHSCAPNVFWQVVHRGDEHPHIMFFAIKHIPPMTELTYDYGSGGAEFGNLRVKKCYCGSQKCRGVFI